jgi:exosortase/archaeosortase family protein
MKIPDFIKNPVILFLLKALGLYVIWYFIYELWLHPIGKLDIWVIKSTLKSALMMLKFFGFQTFTGGERLIGIDGTSGLWMGDNCDCIELCALFAGFIIAFPGNLIKKLWYIPSGIVLIFVLNVLRMIFLSIVQKNFSTKALEFNHTYTFTVMVYLFIFLLWFYWIKKLTGPTSPKTSIT